MIMTVLSPEVPMRFFRGSVISVHGKRAARLWQIFIYPSFTSKISHGTIPLPGGDTVASH